MCQAPYAKLPAQNSFYLLLRRMKGRTPLFPPFPFLNGGDQHAWHFAKYLVHLEFFFFLPPSHISKRTNPVSPVPLSPAPPPALRGANRDMSRIPNFPFLFFVCARREGCAPGSPLLFFFEIGMLGLLWGYRAIFVIAFFLLFLMPSGSHRARCLPLPLPILEHLVANSIA